MYIICDVHIKWFIYMYLNMFKYTYVHISFLLLYESELFLELKL